MDIPFSQACENNKQPILSVLSSVFSTTANVLEIGSGTGQHAAFFAENLPHLIWQPTDLAVNHHGINVRRDASGLKNLLPPKVLDLHEAWPSVFSTNETQNYVQAKHQEIEGIFTANTLHIVSWNLVQSFFSGVNDNLCRGGLLCIYGPFNYQGKYTSASNAEFDLWLKNRDPSSGIRDIEAIRELATAAGLKLLDDHAMPANNRLLVFSKK